MGNRSLANSFLSSPIRMSAILFVRSAAISIRRTLFVLTYVFMLRSNPFTAMSSIGSNTISPVPSLVPTFAPNRYKSFPSRVNISGSFPSFNSGSAILTLSIFAKYFSVISAISPRVKSPPSDFSSMFP